MKDQSKTKQVLIQELASLRQKIAELEQSESEYKNLGEALRKSEEKYSQLSENAHDAILSMDLDGIIQYANRAACDLASPVNLIGLSMRDITPPNLLQNIPELLRKRREGDDSIFAFEWEVVAPDSGRHVIMDVRSSLLTENGKPSGVLVIARDVTDNKLREEVLRESEERYRKVVSSADVGIILQEKIGIIRTWNTVAERIFGISAEEALGQTSTSRDWKTYREDGSELTGAEHPSMHTLATGEPCRNIVMKVMLTTGGFSWINVNTSPIFKEGDSKPSAVVITFLDITERKRLDKIQSDLIEKNPMSIQIMDKEGFTLQVNPSHTLLFGALPPPDFSIFADLQNKGFDEFILLAKKGEVVNFPDIYFNVHDIYSQLPDKPVWIRAVLFPLEDIDGNPERFVFMHEDITERKRVEEKLRRSEENFRRSLDESPLGVRIMTAEGETIYANRAILDIYGYDSLEELKITPVKNRYTPESFAEHQIRREKRKQGDDVPIEYEIKIVRKDGEVRHLQVIRKEILWDGERQFQVIYQDVTERKQMEQAFRENEQRLHSIINGSPIPTFVIGKDHRVIHWNKVLEEMSRIKSEEIVGTREQWKAFYNKERPCMADLLVDGAVKLVPKWYSGKYIKSSFIEDAYEATDFFPVLGEDGKWLRFTAAAIRDSKGMVVAAVETLEDITENRRAEEARRESEGKYRKLIETTRDLVYTTDRKGFLTYMNPTLERTLGYTYDELNGKTFAQIVAPAHIDSVMDVFRRAMRGESIPVYEVDLVRKDGTRLSVEFNASTLYDNEGKPTGRDGIGRDITERKRTELALRESENRYRELFENMGSGVSVYETRNNGEDFIFKEYNTTAEMLDKTPRGQAIGRSVVDVFPGVKDFGLFDVFQRVYRTGKSERHPVTFYKDEKISGWRENYVYKLPSGEIVAVFEDITQRKRAEEALRESEELLNATQHLTKFGGWVWNVEQQTMFWTNEVYRIHDFVPGEMMPGSAEHITRSSECYDPENRPVILAAFQRCVEEGQPYDFDFPFTTAKGRRLWVRTTAQPVIESGRVIRVIGNIMDITERKQAEEELRTSGLQLRALAVRLEKIREESMIMIAREIHDELGGGLTGVKMDLSWLLHKIGDADTGEARVALMDKIHTSNALIDKMIHVVRRISTDLRPSILDDLGLIAALEWQLSEFTNRTEIPHDFATTLKYVNMEEDIAVAVFRIFQEALTNVVRHARASKVAVVLREGERNLFGDESLVLEIRDNGRGITEEEILNSESLGLLGMKERVLTFGGALSIRGEPGGGTALVLKIPRKQGKSS